jgi:hypothetical protein
MYSIPDHENNDPRKSKVIIDESLTTPSDDGLINQNGAGSSRRDVEGSVTEIQILFG